ncbi:hypothetical protein [Bifidobacterium breve]|uniref:hypothetical protein n=1 Tax=Bifidobacterium breve TaxID=1685 RepID=UPI0016513852|nr:hypothetical protein [Bifidobacterium breve]
MPYLKPESLKDTFDVSFDSGDVRAAVVLTRPQLEQLRSCVTDSLARDDAVRRRRGGEDAAAICDGLRRR